MKNVLLRLSDLHNDVHAMYTSDTLCSGYRKRYCMGFGTNTKQTATYCSKAMLVIDQALCTFADSLEVSSSTLPVILCYCYEPL